jgi:hypothetical protein
MFSLKQISNVIISVLLAMFILIMSLFVFFIQINSNPNLFGGVDITKDKPDEIYELDVEGNIINRLK